VLRSRQRRLAIGQKVSAAMVALEPAERTLLMDTLGDLALSLVCRPKSAWSGSPDELAEAVGARGSNVAALLSVHVAADVGLLVGAAGGGLRFRDADAVTWLAARRTAASRDARGLGVYRLHGALFDVFAMAVAELDEASAMPMVQALAVPGDDAWTALELSTLQAVAACAWGAAADGAERASMRPCAARWVGPSGLPFQRQVGAAFLMAEAADGAGGAQLRAELGSWVEATAHDLMRPGYTGHPVLTDMLHAYLAAVVGPHTASRAEWAELAAWLGPLGEVLYRAIGATALPGTARDGLFIAAAERGFSAGDPRPLALLAHVDAADPRAADLANRVLDEALTAQTQGGAKRALVVAAAVAAWAEVGEETVDLLATMVLGEVAPELRIAAARALAAHPVASAPVGDELVAALVSAMSQPDPASRAGLVGAALHLGAEAPEVAASAVALVADGFAPLWLPGALADALVASAAPAVGIADLLARYDAPEIRRALVTCVEPLAARLCAALDEGVYAPRGARLPEASREGLCRALQPIAFDPADPELAARAAMAMGWFARGDEALAARLRAARVKQAAGAARDGFGLAIGAVGLPQDAAVEDLARDLAGGPAPAVAAASQALRWMVVGPRSAAAVEPWVATCLERASHDAPCRVDLLDLARHVAMAPLLDG
jgi:hypothetical protein